MLKNYLKTAWRNFLKNKTFSFINVLGLAIGLCCFLLIALYVLDEISYDKFYKNADRIYRIQSDLKFGGTENQFNTASDPMGAALKQDYPQIEEFTRIYTFSGSKLIKKEDEFFNEQKVGHVDSTFFRVFQLEALAGNINTALNDPNTVVVTESTARKYFGTTDVIGKTIETNDNGTSLYKVTAVIKDIPVNSHFNFDFLFSMDNVQYQWGNYLSHNFYTYVLLKERTDYKSFETNFPQYINKYVLPAASQIMHINNYDDFVKAGNKLEYSLIPLTKIHLYSNRQFELGVNGSIQYVYIFSAVALFILLIACVNFMNLATAKSANRAKEVGIRKVLGTGRKNLVFQFLTESTLMAVFSLTIAIIAAILLLDWFNDLSGKSLSFANIFNSKIIFLLLLLPIVVGVLAGSYPAFFLSRFRPIQVLKGKLNAGTKNSGVRSVLVVFQFATSIILIISTLIVFQQLHYIRSKNLGFDKNQVLILNNAFGLGSNLEAYKNEAQKMRSVKSATVSGYLPVNTAGRNDNTFSKEPVVDSKNGFSMQTWTVDYDYLKTMGMQIAKGRNFSKEFNQRSGSKRTRLR